MRIATSCKHLKTHLFRFAHIPTQEQPQGLCIFRLRLPSTHTRLCVKTHWWENEWMIVVRKQLHARRHGPIRSRLLPRLPFRECSWVYVSKNGRMGGCELGPRGVFASLRTTFYASSSRVWCMSKRCSPLQASATHTRRITGHSALGCRWSVRFDNLAYSTLRLQRWRVSCK